MWLAIWLAIAPAGGAGNWRLCFVAGSLTPLAVQQSFGTPCRRTLTPTVRSSTCPGSRPRALEKARTLPADALILDLEDAVAPAEKPRARELVAEAVEAGGYGRRKLLVRVNGLDTEWGEADLARACAAGPDAILLPKVETPADVRPARRS